MATGPQAPQGCPGACRVRDEIPLLGRLIQESTEHTPTVLVPGTTPCCKERSDDEP
jgi:hypothetical protein